MTPIFETELDALHPKWNLVVSFTAAFDLLPEHPWIWQGDIERSGMVVTGATWTTCADLIVRHVDEVGSRHAAMALRSMIRKDERQVERIEVARLTQANVQDGRPVLVTTHAWNSASSGRSSWHPALTWRELACAAVVVPDTHPLASDLRGCAELVTRIEHYADDAWRRYCLSVG